MLLMFLDLLVTQWTRRITYRMESRKTKFVFLNHLMSSQKCAKNITHKGRASDKPKEMYPTMNIRLPQWQAVANVGVCSHDVLFASQVQTS